MNKLFTFLLLLIFTGLNAQNWEVVAESPEYKIEKGTVICSSTQGFDYEYVVMRYSNLTNAQIDLSFNLEVWYEEMCNTCDGDHGSVRLVTIPANGVVEGSCQEGEDYLKIFSQSKTIHERAWRARLTDLVFNKIQIK